MSYEIFEHKNIRYKLFLGCHFLSSYPMIRNSGGLKNLDILVLENSGYNLKDYIKHLQYKEIFEKIPHENPNIKIYGIDVNSSMAGIISQLALSASIIFPGYSLCRSALKKQKEKISRRDAIKKAFRFGAGAMLILSETSMLLNGSCNGKSIEILSDLNSFRTSVLPAPAIALRDAVAAKIIDEYILPNEKESKKSLNIGVIYGAGHSGIEQKIKSKKIRDITIDFYKKTGYFGITEKSLNKINKLEYKYGEYTSQWIELNLF